MKIQGYAAFETKSDLKPHSYEPGELKHNDVEIQITHCGICHSDVHLIDNDWGFSQYPLVPGHEVVGIVSQVGDRVAHLKKGQRVGVGWQSGACFNCEMCAKGDDHFCSSHQATCVGRPGGYADRLRVDSRYAFVIPDVLSSGGAAPLLCGGITVFTPFRYYELRPSMRVGIIGVGGLGHLAIKFARAFGCEVTVFSHTLDKEAAAKKMGAHHFIFSGDGSQMKKAQKSLDFVLSTVSANIPWADYFASLGPYGKFVVVGAPNDPISLPPFSLIDGQKTLAGSMIGSRWMIQEMLNFSARHKIEAEVEVLPMEKVNEALSKVRQNTARYRMVLKK